MNQQTIKRSVSFSGIGLHTGQKINVQFKPAKEGTGINFTRTDLSSRPRVRAGLESITGTARGTNIGIVNTIEHVLSALYALSVTNIEIDIDGPELPAADGSSLVYFDLIRSAGLEKQKPKRELINVRKAIILPESDRAIVALPHNRLLISFMINYPSDFIGSQYYRFEFSEKGYLKDIAPARTYGFVRELDELRSNGLARGANEENAVVIGDDRYLTPLRFPDELVRHKILDLIGDLSILGAEIKAHIICIRSGHSMNIDFAKKLKEVG